MAEKGLSWTCIKLILQVILDTVGYTLIHIRAYLKIILLISQLKHMGSKNKCFNPWVRKRLQFYTHKYLLIWTLIVTDESIILERAVDGAPSQIPTPKFLTPQHPAVPSQGMTLATE